MNMGQFLRPHEYDQAHGKKHESKIIEPLPRRAAAHNGLDGPSPCYRAKAYELDADLQNVADPDVGQIKCLGCGLARPVVRNICSWWAPRADKMGRYTDLLQRYALPPKENMSLAGKFRNQIGNLHHINILPVLKALECAFAACIGQAGCSSADLGS